MLALSIRSRAAALVATTLLVATHAAAQRQTVDVDLQIPGIGQPIAQGLYLFKFAIVTRDGAITIWSHDGTSIAGRPPDTAMPLFVDAGQLHVVLGDPPTGGQPDLTAPMLAREDLVIRIWISNGKDSVYHRLADRPLRGAGFAFTAEMARNAERLEGHRAADFEVAGAVWQHEQDYRHAPNPQHVYHASSEIGAGRELTFHFDLPPGTETAELTLHAEPSSAPPAITDLHMRTERAENQEVGSTVEVLSVEGSGWLAGLRESYDFCLNCFKRKVPPEAEVFIDGKLFDDWRATREEIPDGATTGRLDSLSLLGLVRFDRSLRVISHHRGVDVATGATTVWYYRARAARDGTPGALQVLVDGGDVTSILAARPEASLGVSHARGQVLVSRYDGAFPALDELDATAFMRRSPDAVWLARGDAIRAQTQLGGSVLLAIGEARLDAGTHIVSLVGSGPAVAELLDDGIFQPIARLTEAGSVDAGVLVSSTGWHQLRLVGTAAEGRVAMALRFDGATPALRTVALLGGAGDSRWSMGPIDLFEAGLELEPGPHALTFRNRSDRNGHLEYTLRLE